MRIRAPKDFWSGVMFCGFAAVAIFTARGYTLGTAGKMGPGYFPLLLAALLAALGATLIARSVVLTGEPVSRFHVVPLAVIAAAVCLFGC
jgi:putative tricarboxylic transport membrane protein